MNAVLKGRSDILKLEDAIKQLPGYDHEGKNLCRITDYFAPGMYAREMWMPAGCLITGKIHLTEHLNILSQGSVSVSNNGESIRLEAPYTFVSPVGTKRAIFAYADSTWTTIHATDSSDPNEIEKEIIADNFEELDGFLARDDYQKFLLEFHLTEEDAQAATHSSAVVALSSIKVTIKKSMIEGLGLFVNGLIDANEVIAPALLNGEKTDAGRYTNHSGEPNAKIIVIDGRNINLVAVRAIEDEEITTDYRENLRAQGLTGNKL